MNIVQQRVEAQSIAQEVADEVNAYYNGLKTEDNAKSERSPLRDLNADLRTCAKATGEPWTVCEVGRFSYDIASSSDRVAYDVTEKDDARFIAEARTGWPIAIKRAIVAEQSARQLCDMAEVEHLRTDTAEKERDKFAEANARNFERAVRAEAECERLKVEVERQERRYQSFVANTLPVVRKRDEYFAEAERLRSALTQVMQVSKWDGIAYELDRCYVIAKDALKTEVSDGDGKEATQESGAETED